MRNTYSGQTVRGSEGDKSVPVPNERRTDHKRQSKSGGQQALGVANNTDRRSILLLARSGMTDIAGLETEMYYGGQDGDE